MSKKPRILIVEDESVVAMDLEQRLVERGYEVIGVVSTGDEAVRRVQEQQPDLVLMDIMLAGVMDGVQTAHEIRRGSQVPIIYLTAYADDLTLERAKLTEASGYVVKPFRDRELHATLQMALQRAESEQSAERQLQRVAKALGPLRGSSIAVEADGRVTWTPMDSPGVASETNRKAVESLTRRERGVFDSLVGGRELDEVAEEMGISRHTVRNHLKSVFRKLDVHSQLELIRKYRPA